MQVADEVRVLIEQAIFTSAQSDHAVGYHLVARSPGVEEKDARELTIWGPSHESLESAEATATSVNFFRLPSGAYCVSKTQIAGEEYSGRGMRTYTNCLIVPPQVFARFANNPFAILRATWAKGLLRVCDAVPAQLVPFQLAGRAAPVDEGLIGQVVEQCGADAIGRAIESLLGDKPLILIGVARPEATVAGILSLFPVSCRRELLFATGLKYSPRRPFHLLVASQESAELRRLYRQHLVSVVDFGASAKSSPAAEFSGWAGYIADAIGQGAISQVVDRLRERQDGLHLVDLDELGELWRQEAPSYIEPIRSRSEVHSRADSHAAHTENTACDHDNLARDTCKCSADISLGHSTVAGDSEVASQRVGVPDRDVSKVRQGRLARRSDQHAPSALIEADSQELLDELERLDDVVFDAMSGDTRAIEEMGRMWPQLLAKLGPDRLDESREQYLRHSLSVWETCLESGLRDPDRALASLQVLSILFGET
jgi:hypothetical protein